VAANSGGTERFADTGQALASLPASGARVADKEPEGRGRWTAHVEVEGWRVFLLFPAKTMTARSALHEATAFPVFVGGVYRLFKGCYLSSLFCRLSKLFNWYLSVELTHRCPAMY
jgi:hypothetical protein